MSQGETTERFIAYRRGWRDSAKTWVKDPNFVGHPKEHIRVAYELGWTAQAEARAASLKTWADTIGYDIQAAIIDR